MSARVLGAAIVLVVASGCTRSLTSGTDADGTGNLPGADAARADTAGDVTGVADAVWGEDVRDAEDPLTCGEMTCAPGQICVTEYCGGGPIRCMTPADGGACPDGWILDKFSPCPGAGSGPSCNPPPCKNPPPHCEDLPPECSAGLGCYCIGPTVCKIAPCSYAAFRDVTCTAE